MNAHAYHLTILSEDREPAGAPVRLSLRGPLQRAIEALHWRAFAANEPPVTAPIAVAPRWAERGEPVVDALVVSAGARSVSLAALRLFAPVARREGRKLVESGVLDAAQTYGFEITATADANAKPPAVFHLDAYPVSIAEPPPAATPVDDGIATDHIFPVYVSEQVLTDAIALARQSEASETGGVLFGILERDPRGGSPCLRVTYLCPAENGRGDGTSFTFTPDTWSAAKAVLDERGRGEIMVGTFHSHPDFCRHCTPEKQRECVMRRPFFSDDDLLLHESVFPAAYSVGLLASHNGTGFIPSLWGWRDGFITRRSYLSLP